MFFVDVSVNWATDVSINWATDVSINWATDVSINWAIDRKWQTKVLGIWKATQLNILCQESVSVPAACRAGGRDLLRQLLPP